MDTVPSANTFAHEIEDLVWQNDISYMEAVLIWCEARGFEPEIGASMVKKSSPLKVKIQTEAENLNYMKKQPGARLI